VHLRSTRDHVLHVVGVTRAVNVRVVAIRGIVFHVRGGNGDTTLTLFRRIVDLVEGTERATPGLRAYTSQSRRQGRRAVVHVTDRAYVHVGLVTFKFFLRHRDASDYLCCLNRATHPCPLLLYSFAPRLFQVRLAGKGWCSHPESNRGPHHYQ